MVGVEGLHFDVYLVMYFKHRLLQSAGRNNIRMQSTRFYSLIPTTDDTPDKPTSFQLVRRFLPLTEHEISYIRMQSTRFYSLISTTDDTPDKPTSFQLVRRFLPLTEHEISSPGTQKPTDGPYSDPS